MNIGKFHYAIYQLVTDYREAKITENLEALTTSLQNVVSNPSNQDFAKTFKSCLDEFRLSCKKYHSTLNDNEVENLTRVTNIRDFVGNNLFEKVKTVIERDQLTATIALESLNKLKIQTISFFECLKSVDENFSTLKVLYDAPEPGEAEIKIHLPAKNGEKGLAELSLEAKEWNQIFSTISEVFDETHPSAKVKSIADGSWVIYLSSTPIVLWGIAVTIRRINSILTEIIKTKKLIDELRTLNVPTKDAEEHQENILKDKFEKLATELVNEHYKGSDTGRKNELVIATTLALKSMSRKLASGSKVLLRLEPPEEPSVRDEENVTEEEKHQISIADQLNESLLKISEEIASTPALENIEDVVSLLPAPQEI